MSELMGDKVAQHVPKQKILEEDFGWSVPVEAVPVPSAGILYNPNSTLYKRETLKIKAMTAHEEDILTSPALLKEGTAIDYIIRSCLIDKSINVDDLLVGDKNALMISIRITGYGNQYNIIPKCENCEKTNQIGFNLSDLGINRLKIKPVEEGKNLFEYNLPVTKKKVHFKFLSVKEQKEKDKKEEIFERKITDGVKKSVTNYLESVIVSIDNITDKNKIQHFIRNMPAYDSKSLRQYMNDNEPGIDMTHEWECKYCQHHNKNSLAVTSEFFWPRI